MVFGFLTYLRLKCIALCIRFMARSFSRPALTSPHASVEVIQIPSRDPGRTIKAQVYRSRATASSSSSNPVLLNWHGSGFVIPGLGSDTEWCMKVSIDAGITVIDTDYRKAPENPFPAALNDAEDVLLWTQKQTELFDTSRIALSGFSAGGNLALSINSILNIESRTNIAAIVAFYPPTDLSVPPENKIAPKEKGAIPAFIANAFNNSYIPQSLKRDDPRVSPLYVDSELFPKDVMIISCEGDNLCLEAENLVARIRGRKSAVNVVAKRIDDVGHAWDKSTKGGSVAERAKDDSYKMGVDLLTAAFARK